MGLLSLLLYSKWILKVLNRVNGLMCHFFLIPLLHFIGINPEKEPSDVRITSMKEFLKETVTFRATIFSWRVDLSSYCIVWKLIFSLFFLVSLFALDLLSPNTWPHLATPGWSFVQEWSHNLDSSRTKNDDQVFYRLFGAIILIIHFSFSTKASIHVK